MHKRLRISLIFIRGVQTINVQISYAQPICNILKILNICKQVAGNLVNESGNVPRRGIVPKFSDFEIVALNIVSEAAGIDSDSLLFAKLQEYSDGLPNLMSRRQYNDRR